MADSGADISESLQLAFNRYDNVEIKANGLPYHISKSVNLHSKMQITGDATLIYDGITSNMHTGYDLFSISGVNRDISISGLTFQGLHTGSWTNAQMAAIRVLGDCQGLIITNCIFKGLVGFSVHQDGGLHSAVQFCQFINCGNGLNVNCDGTIDKPTQLSDNYFNHSEGIESSGAYTWIERNHGDDVYVAIVSAGGDISGRMLPGIRVRQNVVNGVSQGPINGISVNDGCDGALIEGNEINDSSGQGITVTRGVQYPTFVKDTMLLNNIVRRAQGIPIYTPAIVGITGTIQQGNVIE